MSPSSTTDPGWGRGLRVTWRLGDRRPVTGWSPSDARDGLVHTVTPA